MPSRPPGTIAGPPAQPTGTHETVKTERRRVILWLLAVNLAGCNGAESDARTAANFYEGRTLEIIVPFGPGGGTDTWARMMAPYLQKRLGARSSVQVVNIAGATGVAGANDFALRRKPNGLTALVTAGSTFFPYLLGEPMVRYDFTAFSAIVATPVGGVVFVSPKLGVGSIADLPEVAERLIFGGISATGNDLLLLVAFELLELRPKTIMGYSSRGATRVAFEQGETNIEYQTMPAYLMNVAPLVERGLAVPLFSFGMLDENGELVRDPVVPGLPTVRDVYIQLYGREPEGVGWDAYRAALGAGILMQKVLWLHRHAPPEAVEALRAAAQDVVNDEAFLEVARAEVGDYPFYVGPAADRLFSVAAAIPPPVVLWLKDLLRRRYGVERL